MLATPESVCCCSAVGQPLPQYVHRPSVAGPPLISGRRRDRLPQVALDVPPLLVRDELLRLQRLDVAVGEHTLQQQTSKPLLR